MGISAGRNLFTIKSITGTGVDAVVCWCCKTKSGELVIARNNRIMVHDNGMQYLSPFGGSLVGHKACLEKMLGKLVDETNFDLFGNFKALPVDLYVIKAQEVKLGSHFSLGSLFMRLIHKKASRSLDHYARS